MCVIFTRYMGRGQLRNLILGADGMMTFVIEQAVDMERIGMLLPAVKVSAP